MVVLQCAHAHMKEGGGADPSAGIVLQQVFGYLEADAEDAGLDN